MAPQAAMARQAAAAATSPAPAAAPSAAGLVYLETTGCQMNEADSEVVLSLLAAAGYARTRAAADADVLLINTCAIREAAEDKVWARLAEFRAARAAKKKRRPLVGVLGWAAMQAGLALDPFSLTVAVLVAALPSASNVSLLAERFGADNGRIARIILWTTALAFFSFSAAVALIT
jgi:predicted permease